MAVPDLLWACPACGLDRGLRGPEEGTCTGCRTRFDRVRGARIRARRPDGQEPVRTAAEWVDELPDPASLLQRPDPIRSASVRARLVERYEAVREGGRYVNRIEVFGPEGAGTLALGRESLRYAPGEGTPLTWHFADLAAVQASSRTLQVRGRPHPLASFAFPDDSSFLWEQLLALVLGNHCRRTGRGELVELQPRIATR